MRRVSLNAASLASAPELVKKTFAGPGAEQAEELLGELDLRPGW